MEALSNDQVNNVTVETTLSIDDTDYLEFSISPNPSKGIINIASENTDNAMVTMYTVLGKKVFSSAFKNSIDVSLLSKGLYIVEIHQGPKKSTKRLILQ